MGRKRKMQSYQYSGTTIPGVEAVDAYQELERIRKENDGLEPEAVVQQAADPECILHAGFEWDDSKAAHAHRLQQARLIIRSVQVVIESTPPRHIYVNVTTDDRQRYERQTDAASSPALKEAALNMLRGKVRGAKDGLQEFLSICSEQLTTSEHEIAERASEHLGHAEEAVGQLV